MDKQAEVCLCSGVFLPSEQPGIHLGGPLVSCRVTDDSQAHEDTHIILHGPFIQQTGKGKLGRKTGFQELGMGRRVDSKGACGNSGGDGNVLCVCVYIYIYIYIYIFFFFLLHCTTCEILVP